MSKKTFEAAEKAGAHLIVQLKDNQKSLCRRVEAWCEKADPLDAYETTDENKRNRYETRRVGVFNASPAVAGTDWVSLVACVIMVERTVHRRRTTDGLLETSFERAFYLSNRPIEAVTANAEVRKHWAIENTNHHVRDVTFGEDASRIRKNPGIFARIRSFAANIIRRNPSGRSVPQSRFKAAFAGLDYLSSFNYFD